MYLIHRILAVSITLFGYASGDALYAQVLFPIDQCQNPVLGDCRAAQSNWNKTYPQYRNCPVPDQVYACWGERRVSFALCGGAPVLNFVNLHNASVRAFHKAAARGDLVSHERISRVWEHFNAFTSDLGYGLKNKDTIKADADALKEAEILQFLIILKSNFDDPQVLINLIDIVYKNVEHCGYLKNYDVSKIDMIKKIVTDLLNTPK